MAEWQERISIDPAVCRWLKGLADLAETTGKRFRAGIVLYRGSTVVPFGEKLWAVPLPAMFSSS